MLLPVASRPGRRATPRARARQPRASLGAERLLDLHQAVAAAVNAATTVEGAVLTVLQLVCARCRWSAGHAYLLDGDQPGTLQPARWWHPKSSARVRALRKIAEATPVAQKAGLAGRVLTTGEVMVIPDVAQSRDVVWAQPAVAAGIRAAVAIPVLVGSNVAGVLEFFAARAVAPDAALLEAMAGVGIALGRAFEREQAQEALAESEDRFRELFENANDIVYTSDLNGRFVSVNRAGLQLTGYTRDEALQSDITRVVAPESLPLARTMLAQKLSRGGPTMYEIVIMTKDGRRVPLEVCTQLIYRHGRPVGVQGIGRNITKRQQAAAESQRRAVLMGHLIALSETLNQPLSEAEVLQAIGRGALSLSGAARGMIVVAQADATLACRWSQGISRDYIEQALAHQHELPASALMAGAVGHVVELPGGALVKGMKSVLLPDVQAQSPSELVTRLAKVGGYRAMGLWPLVGEGRVMGVVEIYCDGPRTWSEPEQDALHVFCWQAAAALEKARLYEAGARRRAELESLFDISRALRAAQTPAEMYPLLVEHARRLVRADHGSLALLDANREVFSQICAAGLPLYPAGATVPVRGTLLGWVVQTGAPYYSDDVAQEERTGLLRTDPYQALGAVALVPVRSEEEVLGAFAFGRARGPQGRPFSDADVSLLRGIAEIGGTAIRRARLYQNLQQAYVQMVLALAQATTSRDAYTAQHGARLVTLAAAVARALGATADEAEAVRWGARLHDIGKVGVPDHILRKPGPLTEREWAVMRQHPVIGEEILLLVERMHGVAKFVRHHHERWDGTGYPDGLQGEAIPLGARVLAVVDAYGAIVEARPDKTATTHEAAVAEIRRCAGTQFDPRVADAFCAIVERVRTSDDPIV